MHVSLSRLRVLEHGASELIVAFRARVHLVEDADGFIDVQVWQSDHDAGEILMVSRWRDRGAFTAYMKSEAHASSHRRIEPSLQALIKLERLEHLHTYEVVAE
jgi:heme oxygenase (mycobilin-producing)